MSLNSKDRLNIYTFLKTVNIDSRQIKLFEQITTNEIYSPTQTILEKPTIQLIDSHNHIVNNSAIRQDHPVSTV